MLMMEESCANDGGDCANDGGDCANDRGDVLMMERYWKQ